MFVSLQCTYSWSKATVVSLATELNYQLIFFGTGLTEPCLNKLIENYWTREKGYFVDLRKDQRYLCVKIYEMLVTKRYCYIQRCKEEKFEWKTGSLEKRIQFWIAFIYYCFMTNLIQLFIRFSYYRHEQVFNKREMLGIIRLQRALNQQCRQVSSNKYVKQQKM